MFINGKEFLTVKEMADRLGKKPSAIKQLLHNAGKKPVSKNAIYDIEAYDAIKDVPGKGRPRKQPEPEAPAKAKNKK